MALDDLLNQNPFASGAGFHQGSGQASGGFDASPSKTDSGNWSQKQQTGSDLDLHRSQGAVALNELLRQHELTDGAVDSLILQAGDYASLGGSASPLLEEQPSFGPIRTLMVIDQSMADWRNLVVHAPFDAELLLLDRRSDGVKQISDFLGQQQLTGSRPFDTVAIVSEGSKAKLQLGNGSLESGNLADYSDQLRGWGAGLKPDADILIFGCNVGAGSEGAGFVRQLAQLTGADIAASNDRTGNSQQGGDLLLEVRDGAIEADVGGLGLALSPYLDELLDSSQLQQASNGLQLADSAQQTWQEALASANQTLTSFANQANFNAILQEAFGTAGSDTALFDQRVAALQLQLAGDGLGLTLELRTNGELNGAAGAYAAVGHTGSERIYLNADWITNGASAFLIRQVLLEEAGHAIDQRLNGGLDSHGDEGELFAKRLTGGELTEAERAAISADNDSAVLTIDGMEVAADTANTSPLPPPTSVAAIDLDSSSSSPGNEQVFNAFDGNIYTKYLNFGRINSGIQFTYAIPARITGFAITTANDAGGRDPASYTLEAKVSNNTWTAISSGSLNLSTTRFTKGEDITFSNSQYFQDYRIYFPTLRGGAGEYMQLAEINFYESKTNEPSMVIAGGTLAYTENGATAAIDNTISLADVDNTSLTGANVIISTGFTTGDVLGFTSQNGITGVYTSATGVLSLAGTATVAQYEAALRSVSYSSASDTPTSTSASRTISWQVNDGSALSAAVTSTINITAVNDAPTINSSYIYTLTTTDENTTSSSTTTSTILSAASRADVDTSALSGLAITATTGNGTWQYSTDGTSWQAFGSVSTTSSLLLTSTSRVRYRPDSNNGETATFNYKAWDQTTGSASTNTTASYATTETSGGSSAFSTNTSSAEIIVSSINDAPIANPDTCVINEEETNLTAVDQQQTGYNAGIPLKGNTVYQTLTAGTSGYLKEIQLNQNGGQRTNPDLITLSIHEGAGIGRTALNSITISETDTFDYDLNAYVLSFQLTDQLLIKKDKIYTIEVTSDSQRGLVGTSQNSYQGGSLYNSAYGGVYGDLWFRTIVEANIFNSFISIDSTNGLLGNDSDPDTTDVLTVSAVDGLSDNLNAATAGRNGGSFSITANGSYTFNPGTDFDYLAVGESTTTSIGYTISDGNGGSSTSTLSVTVIGSNDAPVLDFTRTPILNSIYKDTPLPSKGSTTNSTLISALVSGISDVDSGALKGIAITAVNSANGSLYYSSNGGSYWIPVGSVSNTSALLLNSDANTSLYFHPAANFNGTITDVLTFRAWDQSTGTTGTKVDTTSNGASTAFSTAEDTVAITVNTGSISSTVGTNTGLAQSIASGGLTKDNTLTLSGSYTDINGITLIEIYDGTKKIGNSSLNNGNWTFTTPALENGVHSFTAVFFDSTGSRYIPANTINVTVDTVAPTSPTINTVAGDDAISNSEKAAGVTLTGTAEPNSIIVISWKANAESRATVTDSDGKWSLVYTAANLPESGLSTIRVFSRDNAGNESLPTTKNILVDAANLAPISLKLKEGAGAPKNAKPGDRIGQLTATDPEGDQLVFSLAGASAINNNNLVELEDPRSGFIRIREKVDPAALTSALQKGNLKISAKATEDVVGRSSPLSISQTLLISIGESTNNAPTAKGLLAELGSIIEGTSSVNIAGNTISALFSGLFEDNGKDQFAGVAFVGNTTVQSQGVWQYKAANSGSWLDIPTISEGNPFILLKDASVRFAPTKTFSGSAGSLDVRLLESSRPWTTGYLATGDALAVGGFGSASGDVVKLKTTITAVPKSPTALTLASAAGVPIAASSTPFASATGLDPDTQSQNLRYSLIKAIGSNTKMDLTKNFSISSLTGELQLQDAQDIQKEASITFTLSVSDGTTQALTRSFNLGVLNNSNVSPTVLPGSQLITISEASQGITNANGTSNPLGTEVATLFGSRFNDATAGAGQVVNGEIFAGIAIVGNGTNQAEGAWQYQLDSKDSWKIIPTVSDQNPFILLSNSLIRYLPKGTFTGTPGKLTIRLLDGSQNWNAGALNKPLMIGGSGPASTEILSLGTTIKAAPKVLSLEEGEIVSASAKSGDQIGQLKATDPDSNSGQLIFSLATASSKNDNSLVTVTSTGIIKLAESDPKAYETARGRGYLNVEAIVTDEGNRSLKSLFRIKAENSQNKAPLTVSQTSEVPDWAPTSNIDIETLESRIYFYESIEQAQTQGALLSTITSRTVLSLFGNSTTFLDANTETNTFSTFAGIAIVADAAALNPLAGRWEYKTNNGNSNWTPLGVVSEARPLLLNSTTSLRFNANNATSGIPGSLTVRLLDNSHNKGLPFNDGRLAEDAVLVAGGSGAASETTLELLTYIKPSSLAPTNIFLATARSILVDADNSVAEETSLGTLTAIDADSKAGNLSYKIEDIADVRDGTTKVIDQIEIINGNELRVKTGKHVEATKLQALKLQVTVTDDAGNSYKSSSNLPLQLSIQRFTSSVDTTVRSETTALAVLPNDIAGFDQALLFSATGLSGALSVEQGAVLTSSELGSYSASDLNINLDAGAELTEITPFAPLLTFSINTDAEGDVVRLEYLLSSIEISELLKIRYLKSYADGTLSVFDYATDDFGVSTGARLEIADSSGYTADLSNYNLSTPIYLAVYIQDNGRGDDDSTLGRVLDPGAPIFVTTSSTSSTASSSSSSSSTTTTSLGIFEVANSDEGTSSTSETATSTNEENATLATMTTTVETVTVTDTSRGGGEGKNLVKGLKQSSQDELRAWAKRLGLLQGLDRLGVMDENGNAENRKPSPLDFINQKLGIDPERSSDLLNALVFGGASIYIINKTNAGLFKQWADALWSTKTNQTRNINRANKVIAIFLMRSTANLDRLVAVELHDDAIEILAEEKLLFSLDSAAQRHQASFENQLRRLCLKLENIGLPIQELLLLDPELKSAVTIVEHLSQETKIMEPNCLGDVVQQLSTTEMDQLQAWLTKPSSNPLDGHPIKSNLQKRQNELGLQLSSEKANVASLIELSLALGMRQPAMSLV